MHKISLNKFQRINFYRIFSLTVAIKTSKILEIPQFLKLNSPLLDNSCINEETQREIRNYFELNNNENNTSKFVECSLKSAQRVYSLKCLIREEEKFEISDLYFQLKNLGKEEKVKIIRRR